MDQAELLTHAVNALESSGAAYAITGSHASIAYGEIRFTNDIDILTDLDDRALFAFLAYFPEDDFYVSEEAARAAIRTGGQFNIIHPTSAQKIDVIIAANETDRAALARVRTVQITSGVWARVIAPEDLIVKKLEFYREGGSDKHLRDIAAMLAISHHCVDVDEIARRAAEMGAEQLWLEIITHYRKSNPD